MEDLSEALLLGLFKVCSSVRLYRVVGFRFRFWFRLVSVAGGGGGLGPELGALVQRGSFGVSGRLLLL